MLFFFRAALLGGAALPWFGFLDTQLASILSDDLFSHLAQKIWRPFLRPWIGVESRAEFLVCHYAALTQALGASSLAAFFREPGFPLARLTGKSNRGYDLIFGLARSKEGEVYVSLNDNGTKAPLTTLVGAVGPYGAGTAFWIGGLQGAKPPHGRDEIVQATRALSGLRPKQAVLHAASAIARAMGVAAIIAPARRNHISCRGWRRWRRYREIRADYDGFWVESGGVRLNTGDYALPLVPAARASEQVKSKKRKEWSLRRAQLDSMEAAIENSLAAMKAR